MGSKKDFFIAHICEGDQQESQTHEKHLSICGKLRAEKSSKLLLEYFDQNDHSFDKIVVISSPEMMSIMTAVEVCKHFSQNKIELNLMLADSNHGQQILDQIRYSKIKG